MKKALYIILAILIVLAGVYLYNKKENVADDTTITGTITYLDRMGMPEHSLVNVKLLDISNMDTPVEISEMSFDTEGRQVPIEFSLPYDASKIVENHTYSISADIYVEGELFRASTNSNLVITNNNPTQNVEIILDRVNNEENSDDQNSSTTSQNNEDIKTKTIAEDGVKDLNNTNYNLASFNGKKLTGTLSFKDGRIASKFCNNVNGEYTFKNGTLISKNMISTMMYCAEDGLMDAESTFSKMLDAGAKVTIVGKTLTLEEGQNRMVFESK